MESDAEWQSVVDIAGSGAFPVPVRGEWYCARGYVYLDISGTLGHMLEFLYKEAA